LNFFVGPSGHSTAAQRPVGSVATADRTCDARQLDSRDTLPAAADTSCLASVFDLAITGVFSLWLYIREYLL